ncbi:glycoside hydrolase family 28 protein, partial [Planctomycetota bacterium]
MRQPKEIRYVVTLAIAGFWFCYVGYQPLWAMDSAFIFNVRNHGALGNRQSDDTQAIQKAIDACAAAGGGMVYVPPGDYEMGPVWLQSNVDFHLEAGVTLWASPQKHLYYKNHLLPDIHEASKWQGLYTSFQLINGKGLANVSITGRGTIHGQGSTYWWGIEKVRPYILKLENCTNVRFENVTTRESFFHTFNFSGCRDVIIRGISLFNDANSPNTDGLHMAGCQDVHISDVTMETGGDCLLAMDGTQDMTVTNCTFRTPWGIFWPISGKNITITDCVVNCQMLVKDIQHAENILISNIVARGRGRLFSMMDGPVANLTLRNIMAQGFAQAGWLENGQNVTLDNVQVTREPGSGSSALSDGFEFRNIRGLTLRHVTIAGVEAGPALTCHDVNDLELDGFHTLNKSSNNPAVQLYNVNSAYIHQCRTDNETVFLGLHGIKTANIRVSSNDLQGAILAATGEVPAGAITTVPVKFSQLDIPQAIIANESFPVQVTITSQSNTPGLCNVAMKIDSQIKQAQ